MKAKKKVFVVAVAVCLIAILSMSSLAWFSDKDEVTNEFHISTSDDPTNPDDIFSVDLWESVDTDGDGVEEKIAVGDDTNGATYEHIYPSQTLVKEPRVENTGIYDQWIRVKITASDARAWNAICNELAAAKQVDELDLSYMFKGHDENVWTVGEKVYSDADNTHTYTYYLNEKLEPKEVVTVFKSIVIPEELNQYNLATLDGGFSLKIVAEAIQADNTGDTAQEAFATVMGN